MQALVIDMRGLQGRRTGTILGKQSWIIRSRHVEEEAAAGLEDDHDGTLEG